MSVRDGLQVLLVAPIGRDAELIAHALKVSNVESESMKDVASAIAVFRMKDVGAMLIAEEALEVEAIAHLSSALVQQPSWSNLPVLVLTMAGTETFQSRRQQWRRRSMSDIILLERPLRVTTLVSSVTAALHTRSRQYERRLSETVLRHSEKLAVVGRLASSIAHEINNPLEGVTNLLYLLEGTSLNEQQREYLTTAQQELARVAEIAAQTLTHNRQRDVRGEASMSTLLDSVLVLYQGRLAGSNTKIERRYRNTPPFNCRPGELRQVFANLIGNAFDATRKGGLILLRERAARDLKTNHSGVRITVADTGSGMSAEVIARLFEPFQSTKGLNGNGLGLWISKGIVEKHHGSIRFRSSTKPRSSGTVFSIFIPHEGLDNKLDNGARVCAQ